jgi:hypothetical protein
MNEPDVITLSLPCLATRKLIEQGKAIALDGLSVTDEKFGAGAAVEALVEAGWRPAASGDVVEHAARVLHADDNAWLAERQADGCAWGELDDAGRTSYIRSARALADAGLLAATQTVEVHHHDIEAHATSYNEGYDDALRHSTEDIDLPPGVWVPLPPDEETVERVAQMLSAEAAPSQDWPRKLPSAQALYMRLARAAISALGGEPDGE